MSGLWSVEDLTPEELAELQAALHNASSQPICQDGSEAGPGDSDAFKEN